jgi:hypothetical protein
MQASDWEQIADECSTSDAVGVCSTPRIGGMHARTAVLQSPMGTRPGTGLEPRSGAVDAYSRRVRRIQRPHGAHRTAASDACNPPRVRSRPPVGTHPMVPSDAVIRRVERTYPPPVRAQPPRVTPPAGSCTLAVASCTRPSGTSDAPIHRVEATDPARARTKPPRACTERPSGLSPLAERRGAVAGSECHKSDIRLAPNERQTWLESHPEAFNFHTFDELIAAVPGVVCSARGSGLRFDGSKGRRPDPSNCPAIYGCRSRRPA